MTKKQALIYATKKHRLPEPYNTIKRFHQSEIKSSTITYHGLNNTTFPNTLLNSINYYSVEPLPDITLNMVSQTGDTASQWNDMEILFIVIHDTEGGTSVDTAEAMSNWCTSSANTTSSWHYTVGNDGIYQQLEESDNGWHAGDGTIKTVLTDTGVAWEGPYPTVTLVDNFLYINGKKTTIDCSALTVNTTNIPTLGIPCVKHTNDNYWVPTLYYNSTYNCIAARGGNMNSIGIETCVNNGSDIYLTWHRTAKLVADILIRNNLSLDRVWFHNNFSGKECPKTMIRNNLIQEFLKMVEVEYTVLKNNYSVALKQEGALLTTVRPTTNTAETKKSYTVNDKLNLTYEYK